MTITVEAVYEAGVFKPLTPLPDLKEHEKVRLTIESSSLITEQRQAESRLIQSLLSKLVNCPNTTCSRDSAVLQDIPDGTHCFVDANIFYYHLVNTPPLSNSCSDFLERIERHEVVGLISAVTVAEAIHKVMLAEAVARYGLNRKALAHRLQQRPELIAGLTEHKKVILLVRALHFPIEAITLDLLERVSTLSVQHLLLTNDALIVVVMEKLDITHLATNDDNFDSVAGITVWKPR